MLLLVALITMLAACGPSEPAEIRQANADLRENATPASRRAAAATRPVRVTNELTLTSEPLEALSPQAVAYLETRAARQSIAVILPDRETIYTYNGDIPMPMANVTKLPIMLATLDRRIGKPDDIDLSLLHPMITVSDNDSSLALWQALGGGEPVTEYLRRIGVHGIWPTLDDEAWDDSAASAIGVAQLLAKLTLGDILTAEARQLAMELMGEVVDDQWWGVITAFPFTPYTGEGVKNGWYPAPAGWRVNSAGFSLSQSGSGEILVVMTQFQPSFAYGQETIERVSALIGRAASERSG